ncbi:hypothetical protein MCANPG14_01458 [Mycoplasmopsis canis PG 14]|nr:hypothetical protein [Mycoplasmopsis canis]AMD81231.1 hypothetical protein AXW82_01550 [Mycoplasmopsis canis PG 14]EIE40632.1 hypothetical protein MCANPG14_01458 [Mycoplasmopsis canis PG 14]
MKKKFNFKLFFLSMSIAPIIAFSVSCTAENRTQKSIDDLNKFSKNLNKDDDPRFKFFKPVISYKTASLNGFLEAQKAQGYYFSESQWNNLNAQIIANTQFYQNIKNLLQAIPENKINDKTEGIRSDKFLNIYFTIHGLTENEFTSFKSFVKSYGILQWWSRFSKTLILNNFLKQVDSVFTDSSSKELNNFYETTENIYEAYKNFDLEGPVNEIRNIELYSENYYKEATKRIEELLKVDNKRYSSIKNTFNSIEENFKEISLLFENVYEKYFQIIEDIKRTYFETLQINPILESYIFEYWIKFIENQSKIIVQMINEIFSFKVFKNKTSLFELIKILKDNYFSEEEYNAFTNEYNEQKDLDSLFNKILNKIKNSITDDKYFEESKLEIEKYIKENKKEEKNENR